MQKRHRNVQSHSDGSCCPRERRLSRDPALLCIPRFLLTVAQAFPDLSAGLNCCLPVLCWQLHMPRRKASYLFHVSWVLLLLLQQQLHFSSLRKVLPPGTLSFCSVQIPACPQCGARWEAWNPGQQLTLRPRLCLGWRCSVATFPGSALDTNARNLPLLLPSPQGMRSHGIFLCLVHILRP